MRVLDPGPIADRRQRQDAQIHPHYRPIAGFRVRDLLFHLDRHKPMSGMLTYGGAQDVHTLHRQITALFQSQASQPRQLDGLIEDMNGARQPEATQPVLLRLELLIPNSG